MKSNRTWIVTEIYYPVMTSTGYIITEIAEYLAKYNDKINVICTGSKYNESNNFEFLNKEVKNNVNIYRVNAGNINKNNSMLRTIRLIWSSILLIRKIFINVEKGDKLFVVTNPAILLILLPIVKRIKKINYTILVHDVFPENLVAVGKIKNNSILYKIIKIFFNIAYSHSFACIVIGRDMMQLIKEKTCNKTRLTFIPNWADVDNITPKYKTETKIIRQLKLEDKFVFQFAGNIGHAQGIENLLEAIKLVTNSNLHFLFIGSGAKEKLIVDFIAKNSLNNVTLIGFQNRSEQNEFLNACDISIITLSNGMFGLGVPSKSYNIMAAGKPIIIVADENSEISLCVKEFNIGWVVEPNNPKALMDTFIKVSEDSESFEEIKLRSRQIAETQFAKDIILNQYLDVLT